MSKPTDYQRLWRSQKELNKTLHNENYKLKARVQTLEKEKVKDDK